MLSTAEDGRGAREARRAGGGPARRAPALGPWCALAPLLAGCIASYQTVPWVDTQRHPPPMEGAQDLPPGVSELWQPGPEVVEVVRLSDPVTILRPGIDSSYPLAFWDKSARVSTGSGVFVDAGGRAEIAWDDGSRLMLVGPTTGVLGSPSRSEPAFVFGELERAGFHPAGERDLWLVGGARLTAASGPVLIERVRQDLLRVDNRSPSLISVRYRDELIELDAGQRADLALLAEGSRPFASALGWDEDASAGFSARLSGRYARASAPGALAVRAQAPVEVEALGVRVTLAAGESALLTLLGGGRPPEFVVEPEADGGARAEERP